MNKHEKNECETYDSISGSVSEVTIVIEDGQMDVDAEGKFTLGYTKVIEINDVTPEKREKR